MLCSVEAIQPEPPEQNFERPTTPQGSESAGIFGAPGVAVANLPSGCDPHGPQAELPHWRVLNKPDLACAGPRWGAGRLSSGSPCRLKGPAA